MKKLMFSIVLILFALTGFCQLNQQSGTLVVPAGTDSVFTFNGYARGAVYIEIDFRTANKYDGSVGIGGSRVAYDASYSAYASVNNPIALNLTNFPDTICRIERTVGLSAPYLKIKLTKGTVTTGKVYPIKISFDRF